MRENSIERIVVGTDFSPLATAALRFASGIAGGTGAELIVVYADTFDAPAEFTTAQVRRIAESIERSKKRVHAQVELHVAREIKQGVTWRAIVAEGLPAPSLSAIADAEGADFITVGTHGRGGLQRLVMGSVAEAVIREARVPVLTVRSTEVPAAVRRILCPVNAGDAASAAASHAARIAGALGAELTLFPVAAGAEEEQAEEVLRIAESGEYDMIVVGAEHRLIRDVTLFGTTSASITRHSLTPVLIVTHPPAGVQVK